MKKQILFKFKIMRSKNKLKIKKAKIITIIKMKFNKIKKDFKLKMVRIKNK